MINKEIVLIKKIFLVFISLIIVATGNCVNAECYLYYGNYNNYQDYYPQVKRQNRRYVTNRFAKPVNCFARPRIKTSYEINQKRILNRTYRRKLNAQRYLYTSEPTTVTSMDSRFNKNHNIAQNNKKISCGGVTYYGTINPCK